MTILLLHNRDVFVLEARRLHAAVVRGKLKLLEGERTNPFECLYYSLPYVDGSIFAGGVWKTCENFVHLFFLFKSYEMQLIEILKICLRAGLSLFFLFIHVSEPLELFLRLLLVPFVYARFLQILLRAVFLNRLFLCSLLDARYPIQFHLRSPFYHPAKRVHSGVCRPL